MIIDNLSSKTFQPNDIIFHKVIDTKSNNVLGYENSNASNIFNYVLSNNNSSQIDFFIINIYNKYYYILINNFLNLKIQIKV